MRRVAELIDQVQLCIERQRVSTGSLPQEAAFEVATSERAVVVPGLALGAMSAIPAAAFNDTVRTLDSSYSSDDSSEDLMSPVGTVTTQPPTPMAPAAPPAPASEPPQLQHSPSAQ